MLRLDSALLATLVVDNAQRPPVHTIESLNTNQDLPTLRFCNPYERTCRQGGVTPQEMNRWKCRHGKASAAHICFPRRTKSDENLMSSPTKSSSKSSKDNVPRKPKKRVSPKRRKSSDDIDGSLSLSFSLLPDLLEDCTTPPRMPDQNSFNDKGSNSIDLKTSSSSSRTAATTTSRQVVSDISQRRH